MTQQKNEGQFSKFVLEVRLVLMVVRFGLKVVRFVLKVVRFLLKVVRLYSRWSGLYSRWSGLYSRWSGLYSRWSGLCSRWSGLCSRWSGLLRVRIQDFTPNALGSKQDSEGEHNKLDPAWAVRSTLIRTTTRKPTAETCGSAFLAAQYLVVVHGTQ